MKRIVATLLLAGFAFNAYAAESCQAPYDRMMGDPRLPSCDIKDLYEGSYTKLDERTAKGKCCWEGKLCDYEGFWARIDLLKTSYSPDCDYSRWERKNCVDNKYCKAMATPVPGLY